MLLHVLVHRLIEKLNIFPISPGAFALKMQNGQISEVIIFIARILHPLAQIDVFGVHEELFIKTSKIIYYVSSRHKERAGKSIHFEYSSLIKMAEIISGK